MSTPDKKSLNAEKGTVVEFILDGLVNEPALDRIFDLVNSPDTQAKKQIPFDKIKLPNVLEGFRQLYRLALAEHAKNSRELRSTIDKAVSQLQNDLASLQKRLTSIDQFGELFQAITLDLHLQQKTELVPFSDTLMRLHDSLNETQAVTNHLQRCIVDFDRMNEPQQLEWASGGKSELERQVRSLLYSYFRKRSVLGPETVTARGIAQLYEFIYENPVSFSRTKMEFSSNRRRQFHDGLPLRFACAVIQQLKLYEFMAPPKVQGVSMYSGLSSPAAGRRKVYDYGDPVPGGIANPDHPFPWETRQDEQSVQEHGDDNPWESIKNTIAGVWEKDKLRTASVNS